jgi:hypothetical protein
MVAELREWMEISEKRERERLLALESKAETGWECELAFVVWFRALHRVSLAACFLGENIQP